MNPKVFFGRLVPLARELRLLAFRLYSPLDHLVNKLNGKDPFPPISLRRHVGPLNGFETQQGEFVAYLKLVGEMKAADHVLDIGCGCGLIALPLTEYLDHNGLFVGVDVYKPATQWCQDNITKHHPKFTFQHINIQNNLYNPYGSEDIERFAFPFPDHSFDLIFLKSVFTHLQWRGVRRYLGEIARMLTEDGRCLASFFFLNEEQDRLANQGLNALNFSFGDSKIRYISPNVIERAVAFSEGTIIELCEEAGLVLRKPFLYGTWSGRNDGLSFQDLVVLEKSR